VGESGALRHLAAFREFCRGARAAGCRVGLEHFGNRFSQVGSLHDLGLDYVKVDASFIGGIASNRGNQTFLKGLATIAHALDWQVFAEGVATADELAAIADLDFDGATGPAVQEPAANRYGG
jgi:EAL domain-containing protein (putative c-di-GMP-specific phosphodiesterase class I)